MSSEKPFWKGKTLMEIQNLDQRVKVTMENGDVFIGKLIRRSRDTDGICHLSMQLDAHRTYLHVFSAESSDTQPVIPSYVDTVELLDDPEYERIDSIEDVREGDIFVAKDLNRYSVCSVLRKEHGEDNIMSDYKQRMIREHRELQERISKLAHMLEGYAEGTLDFTPACSFQLLESQLYAMGTYANILQERARIEQVDLNAPLEGGESGEVSQD